MNGSSRDGYRQDDETGANTASRGSLLGEEEEGNLEEGAILGSRVVSAGEAIHEVARKEVEQRSASDCDQGP